MITSETGSHASDVVCLRTRVGRLVGVREGLMVGGVVGGREGSRVGVREGRCNAPERGREHNKPHTQITHKAHKAHTKLTRGRDI